MSHAHDQARFATAILDPEVPPPAGLAAPDGRPAGKRFDVYRNNVIVSLSEALKAGFPVICRLVGDEFFQAMAGIYVRAHLPKSPIMSQFGGEFPGFLAEFEPVAQLPYLPDIARLELALRQSYHAADAPPLAPETLQALPPETLLSARFAFAPAMRLLRSEWPVHAIWQANAQGGPAGSAGQQDGTGKPSGPEDVLICRPGFDPEPRLLPAGGAAFITAALAGNPLEAALDKATQEAGAFDLAATLGLLLAGGCLTRIIIKETQ